MSRLEIVLPWPDKALWPNRKTGRAWQTSQKAKKEEQAWAWLATVDGRGRGEGYDPPRIGDIVVRYIGYPPSNRRWDRNGLYGALKAAEDGIAQALGCDDSRFNPVTIERGPACQGGRVIVLIGDVESD